MIDISLSAVGKSFGEVKILDGITFDVVEGRKAAIVGKNGCGKTTLMHIIAGTLPYDLGEVSVHRSKSIGVMDQLPVYPAGITVKDVLDKAFEPARAAARELAALEPRLAGGEREVLRRYDELMVKYELLGGYSAETEIFRMANGLGIPKELWPREYDVLSGGEKTRVGLCRLLLEKKDILLLDEPTNHLDMNALIWLENYLNGYKGTVVLVSHDRYFLDRVTDMTIELADTHAKVYDGNYSRYCEQKEADEAEQQARYEQEQKNIDRLSFTAERMKGWGSGNSKMMHRAFALEHRIERLKSQQAQPVKKERGLGGKLEEAAQSGYDALYVDEAAKSYGEKEIFSGINLEVKKDEAIALIGENGSGKTTLLKLLTEEEEPTRGRIRWGTNIKMAYLPQQVFFPDENATVLETTVNELRLTEPSARNRLGMYQFRGDEVFKTISVLSGGEKSRLRLCLMLYDKINTLILDEPTNHLDIASREWIEGLLDNYEGTMIFVSHDRYFINRFATRIWVMENGHVTDFKGTYEEYRRKQERDAAQRDQRSEQKPERQNSRPDRSASPERLLRKAERELAAAEAAIEKNEADGLEVEAEMLKYETDHVKLTELCEKKEALSAEGDKLYTELESITERVNSLKKDVEV